MPNVIQKTTYAKKAGEGWGTEIELVSAKPQEIIIGWGSQKDAATVQLDKGKKFFDSEFETITPDIDEEDLVRFYMAKNKALPYTFTTDDLLFEGTVDSAGQKIDSKGNIVTVKTFNFYEVFFDVEVPYYEPQLTFIEHVRNLLDNILRKAGTVIEWDPNNPTLKKDGSPFPKKALALDYTPAFLIIEKLCSEEYTDDGQYVWYLSKGTTGKRQLSIRAKTSSTQSLVINEELPIHNIDISKGKDAVVNYVIYNCGIDLYGNSVEDFTFDAGSIGKYGWKTDFIIDETGQLFASLHAEEINQNSGDFTFDSNGNLTSAFPSGYPYTFHFDSSITVNDDSDFNEQLRIKALETGFDFAWSRIQQMSKTQYIVNISLPFRNDLVIGALYDFDLIKLREFDKRLRLKQITYTMNGITASFDQDTKDRE